MRKMSMHKVLMTTLFTIVYKLDAKQVFNDNKSIK